MNSLFYLYLVGGGVLGLVVLYFLKGLRKSDSQEAIDSGLTPQPSAKNETATPKTVSTQPHPNEPDELDDFLAGLSPGSSEATQEVAPRQPSTPRAVTSTPMPTALTLPADSAYSTDPEHQKAYRFARTIVSDFKLYHGEKISKAQQSGDFYKVLGKDLREVRTAYERRVPERVRQERDYLTEMLDELAGNSREARP